MQNDHPGGFIPPGVGAHKYRELMSARDRALLLRSLSAFLILPAAIGAGIGAVVSLFFRPNFAVSVVLLVVAGCAFVGGWAVHSAVMRNHKRVLELTAGPADRARDKT